MNKIQYAVAKLFETDNPDLALRELLESEDMSIEEKVQVIRGFIKMLLDCVDCRPEPDIVSFKKLVKTFKPVLVSKEDLWE